jgi:hypothetical protein
MAVDEANRIYLRGELAKLRNEGDAADFIASGPCVLAPLRVASTVRALTALFARQDAVDTFVAGLTPDDVSKLTDCCERWRRNGVAGHLARARTAERVSAPVEKVLLRDAEPGLVPIFSRHGYWLPAVATDPDLLASEPYRSRGVPEHVDLPWCIARRESTGGGMFRLLDGVHRAIQLFRNGEREVPLCVVGE